MKTGAIESAVVITSQAQTAYGHVLDATLAWNTFQGSAASDVSHALVVDASGNQFVCGYLGNDAAVWKLDSNGNLLWTVTLGGTANDQINGITLDAGGNIYVTGYSGATWGTPVRSFGGGTTDAFVAKLNSSGAVTWNTFLGAGGNDYGYGIDVDASGNVHVSGNSSATWGAPLTSAAREAAYGQYAQVLREGRIRELNDLGGTLLTMISLLADESHQT